MSGYTALEQLHAYRIELAEHFEEDDGVEIVSKWVNYVTQAKESFTKNICQQSSTNR